MPGRFDCDWCRFGVRVEGPPAIRLPAATEDARRRAHCGWLDESLWVGEVSDLELDGIGCRNRMVGAKPSAGFDGVEWPLEGECPGSATRSPAVNEIGEAYAALDAGALRDFFPDFSNVMAEGLLELKRSLAEYERITLTATKEENRHG